MDNDMIPSKDVYWDKERPSPVQGVRYVTVCDTDFASRDASERHAIQDHLNIAGKITE
jgi:hypothetical protein